MTKTKNLWIKNIGVLICWFNSYDDFLYKAMNNCINFLDDEEIFKSANQILKDILS